MLYEAYENNTCYSNILNLSKELDDLLNELESLRSKKTKKLEDMPY